VLLASIGHNCRPVVGTQTLLTSSARSPVRIAGIGRALFALTLIAVGIIGLVKGDFAPIWDSVPKGVPARTALAYLCALISLGCGIGLLWRRAAALASRVLLAYLLLWLLLVKGRFIFLAPTVEGSYQSCGETAVLVAGAWVLYAWFTADGDRRLGFTTGETGVRIARIFYGLAMIAFGLSHFAYVKETAALVPGWLPAHTTWAHLTGGAYVAAGVAVLIGVYARLAAALSALQMGLFTLLVWVPILAAGSNDVFQWSETVLSSALTTAGWVVADSYRGVRWLAMGER